MLTRRIAMDYQRMITEQEARDIVYKHFNSLDPNDPRIDPARFEYKILIDDRFTLKKRYGWVFKVNSSKYLETQEAGHNILGVGPVIVEKDNGTIYRGRTIFSTETEIKLYEIRKLPLPLWLRYLIAEIYVLQKQIRKGYYGV